MDGSAQHPRRRWEWWHRQTPTTRRVLRTSLTLLVTGLLALALGISTATTESSLGPHRAQYSVTLDRQVSLVLGPLGSVIIDSPLPWPLGAEVVVHEIPIDLETAGSPLTGLLADAQAYGQLFSQPDAAIADAVRGLVSDALGRTAVAWSVALALIAAGRLASRGRLRDEVKLALSRRNVLVLGTSAVLAVGAATVVPAMRQSEPVGRALPVLEGTPLEGARITGRLADIVGTYGVVVKDAFEENRTFYALARENLVAAHAADDQSAPVDPPPPDVAPEPGAETPTEPDDDAATAGAEARDDAGGTESAGETLTADAEAAADAGGTGSAGETATPGTDGTPEPTPEPDPATFLMVSDLHCNVGMAEVIGAAVDLFDVDAVLDAGDTVVSGTSVESYCIDAFARAVPGDVPVVVATGNHDSITTAEQEREVGWTVLGGEVVDVAGVRILGDTDPTLTSIGSGTRPERDETIPQMERRLADVACAEADRGNPVDVLLIHNPRAGGATLAEGCARLQLSGHWHRTVGPEPFGAGLRYVSTSSGGGAGGGATVGPLTGEAEVTVVRVDRESGQPMDYRRVRIGTDASVRLGTWFRFPEPVATATAPDGATGTAPAGAPTPTAPAGEPTETAPTNGDGQPTDG